MEENEIVSVVKIKIGNYEVSVECAEDQGFVVLQKHTYIYKIYIYIFQYICKTMRTSELLNTDITTYLRTYRCKKYPKSSTQLLGVGSIEQHGIIF